MEVTITIPTPTALLRMWRWSLLALLALAIPIVSGGGQAYAAFPGVNGTIVFESTRDGNKEIYVMNADGSGQTRLTNNAANDFWARWSPDGGQLLFTRDELDLYKMNADGTNLTQLTFLNNFTTAPGSWSPSGTQVAFQSTFEGGFGNEEIYKMNANGTGITRLTTLSADDRGPAWSPDGTKIAWCRDAFGTGEIYLMNADGSGQVNLTNNAAHDCGLVDWSPDGTKIVFTRYAGNANIYVMNADGTGQTQLTTSSFIDDGASWSPDGSKIVFTSNRDGNFEIYTMDPDGNNQTRITNNTADDTTPSWQPRAVMTIENYGRYHLPKTCFDVENSSGAFLFQVCDNDFAGAPAVHAACVGDGVCNDDSSFPGVITLELADASYIVDQTTLAPNQKADQRQLDCDASGGSCSVAFMSTPNVRPWHPWDITGGPGGTPNGVVRVEDILAVVQHYFDDKPLSP